MITQSKKDIERHVKTHSVRAAEDYEAVSTLSFFLQSNGRINPNIAVNDKWPNHDGTLELVVNPRDSRRPIQAFYLQVKGTKNYGEKDGIVSYALNSLAFPAFVATEVTLDPSLLFVVLNPADRNAQRVFWKYMSVDFLNSIDYSHDSVTIYFSKEEEILCTDESLDTFCNALVDIVARHRFINKLSAQEYTQSEVVSIVKVCDDAITREINSLSGMSDSRDIVSQHILPRLDDLCTAALLLNSMKCGESIPSLQLAWEQARLNPRTRYLADFLNGLKYLDRRIPANGQSERLMLKYYDFLWQIRDLFKSFVNVSILANLEKFPLNIDLQDAEYYSQVATVIRETKIIQKRFSESRFYVAKSAPFFCGKERFFEITLQLAGPYATKYNRLTVYSKENILTDYPIHICYNEIPINLLGIDVKIKIVANWVVSIPPVAINLLGKILGNEKKISSKYKEYSAFMKYLTETGINIVDLIDFEELLFEHELEKISVSTSTQTIQDWLKELRTRFACGSNEYGRHVIRYLLLDLREEVIRKVMPQFKDKLLSATLRLSSKCIPFEKNPYVCNLVGRKTNKEENLGRIIKIAGDEKLESVRPYLRIRNQIESTGELFVSESDINDRKGVEQYNKLLDSWERSKGNGIYVRDGMLSIQSYVSSTSYILSQLVKRSKIGNQGQKEYNSVFLKRQGNVITDDLKRKAIEGVFTKSRILLIYGAAGTGKTTLINYISNLLGNVKKLFLTKTHAAKQNLQRRIDNPGSESMFVSIDSYTKKYEIKEFSAIFVDECSTVGNQLMQALLEKTPEDSFLVLAGDIYQIESIDFGNWFGYAKHIITEKESNVELHNTWRTNNESLIDLWDEVRNMGPLVTEKLAYGKGYSEDIGESVFRKGTAEEIILCLSYDGKYGINNMNSYFQNGNQSGEAVPWCEWSYKKGDPILFNESQRFSILHNNLKGRIFEVKREHNRIDFTVDVEILLTEKNCKEEGLKFVSLGNDYTRIAFSVFRGDDEEGFDASTVVPFQLAYAVSIHKAQGLEYDSVKVVIPDGSSERITHGIFYTAITRAKKDLKIYWSAETMTKVLNEMSEEKQAIKSLEIVRDNLG